LSEKEALEAYKQAKAIYANDVVHLDDLDCGHWTVKVYSTDSEKQTFYRDRLKKLYQFVLVRS
jgi:hypothetical protein